MNNRAFKAHLKSKGYNREKLAEELKAEPAAGVVLVNEKPENGNYMEKKQELT